MRNSLETTVDRERAALSAVRDAWVQAVKDGDVARLADLMTDDVVGVHADGQCIRGKEELKRFFQDLFDQYDVTGTISSSDVVIHGLWAVEIDKVETTRPNTTAQCRSTLLSRRFLYSVGNWMIAGRWLASLNCRNEYC